MENNTAEQLTTVAVYGTLKEGWGNHRLLEHVPKHSDGWVGGHRLFQQGIPFLIADEGSDYNVKVEVYKVDADTLHSLDGLEGHPTCYCRKELAILDDDGNHQETAWVYEYPSPIGEENTTGIF